MTLSWVVFHACVLLRSLAAEVCTQGACTADHAAPRRVNSSAMLQKKLPENDGLEMVDVEAEEEADPPALMQCNTLSKKAARQIVRRSEQQVKRIVDGIDQCKQEKTDLLQLFNDKYTYLVECAGKHGMLTEDRPPEGDSDGVHIEDHVPRHDRASEGGKYGSFAQDGKYGSFVQAGASEGGKSYGSFLQEGAVEGGKYGSFVQEGTFESEDRTSEGGKYVSFLQEGALEGGKYGSFLQEGAVEGGKYGSFVQEGAFESEDRASEGGKYGSFVPGGASESEAQRPPCDDVMKEDIMLAARAVQKTSSELEACKTQHKDKLADLRVKLNHYLTCL